MRRRILATAGSASASAEVVATAPAPTRAAGRRSDVPSGGTADPSPSVTAAERPSARDDRPSAREVAGGVDPAPAPSWDRARSVKLGLLDLLRVGTVGAVMAAALWAWGVLGGGG